MNTFKVNDAVQLTKGIHSDLKRRRKGIVKAIYENDNHYAVLFNKQLTYVDVKDLRPYVKRNRPTAATVEQYKSLLSEAVKLAQTSQLDAEAYVQRSTELAEQLISVREKVKGLTSKIFEKNDRISLLQAENSQISEDNKELRRVAEGRMKYVGVAWVLFILNLIFGGLVFFG